MIPEVSSLAEIAAAWRVTPEDLQREIAAGRLHPFRVDEQILVTHEELRAFTLRNRTGALELEVSLAPAKGAYSFDWPSSRETYPVQHTGYARAGLERWDVVVAIGQRKTLGALRPRAVVFFDERPVA